MQLTINQRAVGDVTALDLSGKLVLGDEGNTFRSQIAELLAAEKKKILLNLGGVSRVDSSGIGLLVETAILTAKQGGQLKLVNLDRIVYNTLRVHRLLPAFEIFDSEADALASF
ncbi:MAG: STAS domain-containing protein [Acidobacteria bacterium]|nr:STAS domain-containing protein [Acidobacteriota bacterium]